VRCFWPFLLPILRHDPGDAESAWIPPEISHIFRFRTLFATARVVELRALDLLRFRQSNTRGVETSELSSRNRSSSLHRNLSPLFPIQDFPRLSFWKEKFPCLNERSDYPNRFPKQIAQEARRRGYASTSAFIRAAIQRELHGNQVPSDNKEQRAESARIQQALARIMTIQQAQFALLDELAQVVLQCMPEPPTAEQEQALALAKKHHERLLTMAALHMQGNARQALEELVNYDHWKSRTSIPIAATTTATSPARWGWSLEFGV
jgi:hypothetical protein